MCVHLYRKGRNNFSFILLDQQDQKAGIQSLKRTHELDKDTLKLKTDLATEAVKKKQIAKEAIEPAMDAAKGTSVRDTRSAEKNRKRKQGEDGEDDRSTPSRKPKEAMEGTEGAG